jgi:ubiquinone/menaquinone biosynthesis C-methylase UbiE
MISKNRFLQSVYDATWGRLFFAGAYDWFLGKAEKEGLSEQRRKVVSYAMGRTLEVATGTGLNLPHYPPEVTELVLTEPYPHMLGILRSKVQASGRKATVIQAVAEELPFPDATFDTVVATMILCSAEDPGQVLGEITRVLKPGGQYLFLEHIRNHDPNVARRQDRLQPAWYLFANGCHCNRDTVKTIQASALAIEELNYDKIPRAWKIVEAMISGRALRAKTVVYGQESGEKSLQCTCCERPSMAPTV